MELTNGLASVSLVERKCCAPECLGGFLVEDMVVSREPLR